METENNSEECLGNLICEEDMAKSKSVGIVIFPEDIERIKRCVKPKYQFAVILALSQYAVDGTMPTEEELGEGGMVAFEFIFDKVADALQTYHENSEKRKAAANARWNADECKPMQADAHECKRMHMDADALLKETETETETETENKKSTVTRSRSSRFIAPTVDEVKAYCQERQNKVDPQKFVDYYTANGWRVGKNPMKDWRACVRTWEKNGYDGGNRDSPNDNGVGYGQILRQREYDDDYYASLEVDLTK